MKHNIPRHSGSTNLQKLNTALTSIGKRAKEAERRGDFRAALELARQACRLAPQKPVQWLDAAVYSIKLELWDEAIRCANQALKVKGDSLAIYDALAHAWGARKNWDEVRKWGSIALNRRLEMFAEPPRIPHEVTATPLPPPPSAQTREHNLIAFSLYGGNSKYCETAILNAIDQPSIYPHWTCVFFVDDTVPPTIVERLRRHARVIEVEPPQRDWPRTMWRFLAYDLPGVHRVIFRDADSLISTREAEAVEEWISSDQRFHVMRDGTTHTELILAGLWGVTAGALPRMQALIEDFLAQPVESIHFADQYFLRSRVWPYARQSLLQHDSHFGFLEGRPFPGGPMPEDFHVGYAEGSPFFTLQIQAPEGSRVVWALHITGDPQNVVCSYEALIQDGKLKANLPRRYATRLQNGELSIACNRL